MSRKFILLISGLLCLGMSCQEFSKSIQNTYNPETQSAADDEGAATSTELAEPEKPGRIAVASRIDLLERAEQQLRNRPEFNDKPIVVYRSLHFYEDGRILTNIQDPDNAEFIDEYAYRDGAWTKEDPLVVTRSMNVERYLLPLDEFSFMAAHRVYLSIQEKMEEIGLDEPMPAVYMVPMTGEPRWYPRSLKTDRFQYSLEFDTEGNLLKFERD